MYVGAVVYKSRNAILTVRDQLTFTVQCLLSASQRLIAQQYQGSFVKRQLSFYQSRDYVSEQCRFESIVQARIIVILVFRDLSHNYITIISIAAFNDCNEIFELFECT